MKVLKIKRSTSRGRDSYGYTLFTLWDGDKKYRTCGGGYDMLGAVFGEWLKDNYLERLKGLTPYDEEYSMNFYKEHGYQPKQENYGLFCRNGRWAVDGACGMSSMERLAGNIGLLIRLVYWKGALETIIIEDQA